MHRNKFKILTDVINELHFYAPKQEVKIKNNKEDECIDVVILNRGLSCQIIIKCYDNLSVVDVVKPEYPEKDTSCFDVVGQHYKYVLDGLSNGKDNFIDWPAIIKIIKEFNAFDLTGRQAECIHSI